MYALEHRRPAAFRLRSTTGIIAVAGVLAVVIAVLVLTLTGAKSAASLSSAAPALHLSPPYTLVQHRDGDIP